jgi:hypothetical protein
MIQVRDIELGGESDPSANGEAYRDVAGPFVSTLGCGGVVGCLVFRHVGL